MLSSRVSGKLDRTLGGEAALLEHVPSGLQTVSEKGTQNQNPFRRSLYILARRNYPLDFLEAFDYPKMQVNCIRRFNSVTPIQSLTFMNDPFLVEQASQLAQRIWEQAGNSPKQRVELAYIMTLSRRPVPAEIEVSQDHLRQQEQNYHLANTSAEQASQSALANLCQTLLSTNEFLYLD